VSGFASKTRAQSVIVVSAVDRTFKTADFSNYGNFANLTSNYSTVSAPGVSILNAVNNGNYATLDGTSMASPIVAGSIALLKSIDPNLRLEDVKSILQNSGLRMLDPIGPLIQVDKAIELVNKNK
jgi:subtilisin family serine protease